jgi:hypothetical protein
VSRGLFWTSLVVTAGGVAAFTITGLKVRDYEEEKKAAIIEGNKTHMFEADANTDACQKADEKNYEPVQSACDNGKQMATVTNVLIGVTAVAAVAAGYFYYKGYIAADRSSSKDEAAAKKRGRRAAKSGGTVIVTPQVYSNGAGLGAVITF